MLRHVDIALTGKKKVPVHLRKKINSIPIILAPLPDMVVRTHRGAFPKGLHLTIWVCKNIMMGLKKIDNYYSWCRHDGRRIAYQGIWN